MKRSWVSAKNVWFGNSDPSANRSRRSRREGIRRRSGHAADGTCQAPQVDERFAHVGVADDRGEPSRIQRQSRGARCCGLMCDRRLAIGLMFFAKSGGTSVRSCLKYRSGPVAKFGTGRSLGFCSANQGKQLASRSRLSAGSSSRSGRSGSTPANGPHLVDRGARSCSRSTARVARRLLATASETAMKCRL